MPEQAAKFPWNMQAIGLPDLWEKLGNRGSGIKIGVIDSGIYSGHPEFQGAHIAGAKTFTGAPDDVEDHFGHGTHCAGLLISQGKKWFGICPDASLYIAKIYNQEDDITLENMARSVRWLTEEKQVDIISASIYMKANNASQRPLIDVLNAEIENAVSKGIAVFSTIGNFANPYAITSYPASCNGVVSVGAYTEQNTIYVNTPVYSKLDILAPGVNVPLLNNNAAQPYVNDEGTSYAVPLVAGFTALLMHKLSCNAQQAYQFMAANLQDKMTSPLTNNAYIKLTTHLNNLNT